MGRKWVRQNETLYFLRAAMSGGSVTALQRFGVQNDNSGRCLRLVAPDAATTKLT
jgi:hypothetical protein